MPVSGRSDAVKTIISRAHEAAVGLLGWQDVLGDISQCFSGEASTLELHHTRDGMQAFFCDSGIAAENAADYQNYYCHICPRTRVSARRPKGSIVYDSLFLSEQEMDRDEFYSDLLGRDGLRYFLGSYLANEQDGFVLMTVQRARRRGHVGADEVERMRLLSPFLSSAIATWRRIGALAQHAGSLGAVLDNVADGIIVIDARCRVRHCNRLAEAILARNDALTVRNGAIAFADLAAGLQFERCMQTLREGRFSANDDRFLVLRKFNRSPYLVRLAPLPPAFEDFGGLAPWAVLFVTDTAARHTVDGTLIKTAFGLTATETSLALAIHEGKALSDWAEQRSVSINTARTHLRRLMQKMDVSRQSEIVARLAAYVDRRHPIDQVTNGS